MAETNKWNDQIFTVLTIPEACKSKDAGVFIFAAKTRHSFMSSDWTPYAIGKTDNIQLFQSYPLWDKAEKKGATHVHILKAGVDKRNSLVEELIEIYKPAVNLYEQYIKPMPKETIMSNDIKITDQLSETQSKLELLYQYEKHYLGLIKEYKEEIKFANTLQEDLRRERSQFFTQTLKDVIQTMKTEDVDKTVSAQWIQDLVSNYTKSIDLSSDLAKTHVFEILSTLTAAAKQEVAEAQLNSIGKKDDAK